MTSKMIKSVCLLSVSLFFSVGSLSAQDNFASRYALGLNAGTTGIGGEITTNMSKKLALRFGLNTFGYNDSGIYDDDEPSVSYSGDLSQTNFSLLADFYPKNRGFKITAGVYYQNFDISASAVPNEAYTFNEGAGNEKVFTPDRLGQLDVLVTYPRKLMPYAGIGFGNPVGNGSSLKLNMSLGFMYSGAPELTMNGDGLISPTTDQAVNFQEGLNEFDWFPVFNLGLSYRFIN